jgi:hypothetical protein
MEMTYKENCVKSANELMRDAFQEYEMAAELESRNLMEDAALAEYRADWFAAQACFYFGQSRQTSRGFAG